MKNLCLLFAALSMAVSAATAQTLAISGSVKDDKAGPLAGVSVVVKGTSRGTVTDSEGKYKADVPENAVLIFSFIGFRTQEIALKPGQTTLDVSLAEAAEQLNEVVISVGTRNSKRTITDSPIPVDILSAADLRSTGQTSFDKALQYRVPSFNTVNTPVNDASSPTCRSTVATGSGARPTRSGRPSRGKDRCSGEPARF